MHEQGCAVLCPLYRIFGFDMLLFSRYIVDLSCAICNFQWKMKPRRSETCGEMLMFDIFCCLLANFNRDTSYSQVHFTSGRRTRTQVCHKSFQPPDAEGTRFGPLEQIVYNFVQRFIDQCK